MSAVIGSMALTLVAALTTPIVSETIDVARIGSVDLKPFACSDTPRSTLIQRVCYARPQRVMIVSVRGDYRASCGVPANLYRTFVTADSMGWFYSHAIGGNPAFRCHARLRQSSACVFGGRVPNSHGAYSTIG